MLNPVLAHVVAMSSTPRSAPPRTERAGSAGAPRATSDRATSDRAAAPPKADALAAKQPTRVPEPSAGTPGQPATPGPDPGPTDPPAGRDDGHRNEVVAVGRVTAAPSERELPSGDLLVTWRICVARPTDPLRSRRRSDSLTLMSFDADTRAAVRDWRVGDVVRVTGSLRRRVWRGWSGIRSVLEVEVATAALVRGADR